MICRVGVTETRRGRIPDFLCLTIKEAMLCHKPVSVSSDWRCMRGPKMILTPKPNDFFVSRQLMGELFGITMVQAHADSLFTPSETRGLNWDRSWYHGTERDWDNLVHRWDILFWSRTSANKTSKPVPNEFPILWNNPEKKKKPLTVPWSLSVCWYSTYPIESF